MVQSLRPISRPACPVKEPVVSVVTSVVHLVIDGRFINLIWQGPLLFYGAGWVGTIGVHNLEYTSHWAIYNIGVGERMLGVGALILMGVGGCRCFPINGGGGGGKAYKKISPDRFSWGPGGNLGGYWRVGPYPHPPGTPFYSSLLNPMRPIDSRAIYSRGWIGDRATLLSRISDSLYYIYRYRINLIPRGPVVSLGLIGVGGRLYRRWWEGDDFVEVSIARFY